MCFSYIRTEQDIYLFDVQYLISLQKRLLNVEKVKSYQIVRKTKSDLKMANLTIYHFSGSCSKVHNCSENPSVILFFGSLKK